jgi:hypothetical protein
MRYITLGAWFLYLESCKIETFKNVLPHNCAKPVLNFSTKKFRTMSKATHSRGAAIFRPDFFGEGSNQEFLEFGQSECAKRCISSKSVQEKYSIFSNPNIFKIWAVLSNPEIPPLILAGYFKKTLA